LAAIDQVLSTWSWIINFYSSMSFIQTIVATALPTITAELGGGSNYSWVGRSAENEI
jgi:hypothetical protein